MNTKPAPTIVLDHSSQKHDEILAKGKLIIRAGITDANAVFAFCAKNAEPVDVLACLAAIVGGMKHANYSDKVLWHAFNTGLNRGRQARDDH